MMPSPVKLPRMKGEPSRVQWLTPGSGGPPEADNHCYSFGIPIALELPSMTTSPAPVEIYCVKCRTKTPSRHIKAETIKNGRPATSSICTECGTRKFRIGVLR